MRRTAGPVTEIREGGRPNPLTGITLKVASVVAFVAMQSCLKLSGQLPPGQLVFFRSFFAILPIVAMLAWQGQLRGALRTAHPLSHVARGAVGVVSMGLGFYALTLLPLPEWIALGYAQPLLVVVIGALFLGETVRVFRWSAVAAGFCGVLIISWPRLTLLTSGAEVGHAEAFGVLICLLSAAISAVAITLVRRLVRTENTATIVLWFSATASVAGFATLPFGWAALSPAQASLLIAAGICGGTGQLLMTEAYRHAELSTVAPFEYTSMLLGIIIGFLAFGDVPTPNMLLGGAVVVASGLVIIWRERRLNPDRLRARQVFPPD